MHMDQQTCMVVLYFILILALVVGPCKAQAQAGGSFVVLRI